MTDWSEVIPTAELLKQTVTMHEVVELCGFEIDGSGKITSPWRPDERTPSAHVYDDGIYDFGSGQSCDVIGFVRLLNPEWSFFKAVQSIWFKALRSGKEPGDVEKSEPRAVIDFTDSLEKEVGDKYFRVGGINCPWDDLHPPANCLWDWMPDNLLIPHQDQDGVYGVKVRDERGSKSAWPGSQFSHRLYDPMGWRFNYNDVDGRCVIAEGETDCWALAPHLVGVVALALPAGAGTWRDHWAEDLKHFDKIYLCMDNDKAGKNARDKLTSKVGYLRAEQLWVPPLYIDARDAIAAGWKPELR